VVVPAAFGFIWLVNPSAVFYAAAGLAVVSLALSQLVPHDPDQGNKIVWPGRPRGAPGAGGITAVFERLPTRAASCRNLKFSTTAFGVREVVMGRACGRLEIAKNSRSEKANI
jgi:hypothetical protein